MKAPDIVMQSYGRCCASASFFDDFYQQFLQSSPEVRAKFTNTDMPAQKLLLRQGILSTQARVCRSVKKVERPKRRAYVDFVQKRESICVKAL